MKNEDVHKKVIGVFAKTFQIPEQKVTEDIAYNSYEKWDSLGHLELVSNLEKAFDISFSMDDVLIMGSVAKCEQIVRGYLPI
ncbi:MAG: hypothetical protein A2898_03185 [Candidatus Kerfeldbacteria bacterium RIFCSPLOWO2_01_FULL_48_11]|uniref:Acyl carrier protein n=3 Tax=Parcubacteria group TaxID=1794811 RepID=A0A0G1XKP1_9BACT|nr:MAG: Acyl carrier protein [Candidatus Kaiserbacteria bacterium GW2011_GWA2_52_12]KKW31445.1 MAG: Acyl carrier protein [Candidatus Kaiserbacteria bacterium GW2011_GWC2_52_8b]OGY85080.1 MAG: hypothetical protein A2898_03185 [Candidatus Kerfeldbacteria bacterium RIFCSPLOWO2_01_FULL_48_11]